MNFKLNPEREKKEEILEELADEWEYLEKEVDEMKKAIESMDNPIKEIYRLGGFK